MGWRPEVRNSWRLCRSFLSPFRVATLHGRGPHGFPRSVRTASLLRHQAVREPATAKPNIWLTSGCCPIGIKPFPRRKQHRPYAATALRSVLACVSGPVLLCVFATPQAPIPSRASAHPRDAYHSTVATPASVAAPPDALLGATATRSSGPCCFASLPVHPSADP